MKRFWVACAFLGIIGSGAQAQNTIQPSSVGQDFVSYQSSFTQLNVSSFSSAAVPVVGMMTPPPNLQPTPNKFRLPRMSPSGNVADQLNARELATTAPIQGAQMWQASGVLVAPETILTDMHVVQRCTFGRIFYSDGNFVPIKVRRMDPLHDLALIDAPVHGMPVSISTSVSSGDEVHTFGYPSPAKGRLVHRQASITNTHKDYLDLKAATQGGESGGGVFNTAGDLIGIIYAGGNGVALATSARQAIEFLHESGIEPTINTVSQVSSAPPDSFGLGSVFLIECYDVEPK